MYNYAKLSIIALGETGTGKSLFCKLFSNSDIFESKMSAESVTTTIYSITFINDCGSDLILFIFA